MTLRMTGFTISLLFSAGCTAHRDAPPPAKETRVEWSAISSDLKPAPDGNFLVDVDVQAQVKDGWHVYSLTQTTGGPTPMTLTVAPSPPYTLAGPITGPPPRLAWDSTFRINSETYGGEAIFHVPVKFRSPTTITIPPLLIKVRSQACSDRLCLPARTTTLTVNPKQSGTT
jgi:hypothetical protein